jgi:hypothetical protein
MLRVIFDTNIYGNLLEEKDREDIERNIVQEKEFIVYSFKPIRNELRNVPKATKLSRQARNLLLNMYDKITENHFLEHSIEITNLARKYCDYYKKLGGIHGWNTNIRVDFMIVACASFYKLDVIYSADNKTMVNKKAIKAYEHINMKVNLRPPYFLKYEDLLRKFRNLL